MDLGLAGRVALVSGAHRGTGAATAAVLAAEGARVAVHGFEPGQADAVTSEIKAAGGAAVAVHGDLFTDEGAAEAHAGTVAALGPVDILVNNYGAPGDTTWTSPAVSWRHGWERNVLTAVRLTHLVVPAMRERSWGRIVFLATVGTARPGVRHPDYYGAKSALPAVARSLAQHLAGTGVTANVVSPGIIATDEVRDMLTRRAQEAGRPTDWPSVERHGAATVMPNLTRTIPDPAEVGRVVAFLCGETGSAIDGADIRVDGGAIDARPAPG